MRQLDHLHLPVSNLDRLLAFYRDPLGLQVGHTDEKMAVLDAGIFLDLAPVGQDIPAGVVVGTEVNEVDALHRELTVRGVKPEGTPEDPPPGEYAASTSPTPMATGRSSSVHSDQTVAKT